MTTARERLAAIGGRADAATPGPWSVHQTMHAEPKIVDSTGHWPAGEVADVSTSPDDYGNANANFIATARTDVPALVAFVTAMLDLCERQKDYAYDVAPEYVASTHVPVAAIDRLADEHLGGAS